MISQLLNYINNNFRFIKKRIFNLKDRNNAIGKILVSVYYILSNLKFLIEKRYLLLRNHLIYGNLYFKRVYSVNADNLDFFSEIRRDKWKNYNRILNGDWDIPKTPFSNSINYQGFKERFKEGQSWESNKYYQFELSRINVSKVNINKRIIDEKFSKFDKLYYEIKKNGIKTKRELSISKGWFPRIDIKETLDDISVDIGRDGQFLICHGKNRLAMVKLLNIKKIPVIIVLRHKKWMIFRRILIENFIVHQKNKISNLFNHPDLQKIPFKRGHIPFEIIKQNITNSKGTLLDIGAKTGYFCLKFEEEGYDCYAVEEDPKCIYLLKKIKKIEKKQFKIISESILDYNQNQELNFDIVLILDGFQTFMKTKDSFTKFIGFLKRINMKEFIFSLPNLKKIQNPGVRRNYNQNDILNLILKNSCLNKIKFLTKGKKSRVFYKAFYVL